MTNAALTATLALKLQDLISGPLGKLTKLLDQLRRISSSINFDRLGEATGKLDKLARGADGVAGGLGRVKRMADEAAASVSRLGTIRVNGAGVASLPPQMLLPAAGGGRGGSGGPGGQLMLGAPDASFSSVPGGGAGGIPLRYDPGFSPGDYARAAAGSIGAAGRKAFAYGRQVGAAGAALEGLALFEPIKEYAEQENLERHIAITEHLSGDQIAPEIARVNRFLNEDALRSGQSSRSLAEAYTELLTSGLGREEVEGLLPAHSQAATAYNIDAAALGPAVRALNKSFMIPKEQVGGALAATAEASKSGLFKVSDFAYFLPGIGGAMNALGMTGRGNADLAMASLEAIRSQTGDASSAATDYTELLIQLTGDHANRMFAKRAGIDLPATLRSEAAKGIDPQTAFLNIIKHLTKGQAPLEQAEIIRKLITNHGQAAAVIALLQNDEKVKEMRARLDKMTQETLDKDYNSAAGAPSIELREFREVIDQLTRRIGEGFTPVLRVMTAALRRLLDGVKFLDEKFPGLADAILLVVGALLLFGAALGVIGFVAPAVAAGFRLVVLAFTPAVRLIAFFSRGLQLFARVAIPAVISGLEALGAVLGLAVGWVALIAVAIGAAAYLIYRYWTPIKAFFVRLWEHVKATFQAAIDALKSAWAGMTAFFSDLVAQWTAPFDRFAARVEAIFAKVRGFGTGMTDALADPPPSKPGDLSPWITGGGQIGGEITVRAAPGAEVVDAKSDNPAVRITPEAAPNRGAMLGRDRY